MSVEVSAQIQREQRLAQLWDAMSPEIVTGDPRPKAHPDAPVSRAHGAAIRVGVRCVDDYLNGQTATPVEQNPEWLAAEAIWDQLDAGAPSKSQYM